MPFLAQARQLSLRRESSSIAQDFTLPGRPNTMGRVSTMSGTETSGVDGLIRGERMVTGQWRGANDGKGNKWLFC
ncbi:hypothetical protein Lal_00012482 [Lupinus albus]|nr:hypothetical protein Lal_00012482 [Lupinus albus]